VKVVDLNLLLYAVNRDSVHHAPAKAWLEHTLSSEETVAIPWVVALGFLRISTSPRVMPRPLAASQALEIVTSWLERPQVIALEAGDTHWRMLKPLLETAGTAGNLTTDAHLAALAIEHDATLCSTDSDFARFAALRWMNPLSKPPEQT
jgi:toxin-antitoxin system PIN domain toxin